ncbi:MAG: hypothetical protein ACRC3Y_00785 [Romboutsia sp.]|uniref:hypothetical protein n=1 Tax=Romboutsia sp. TaxID=1965302 RepID=UPI003F305D75
MNKILTLYNIEFKRIYKLYFALLAGIVASNLVIYGTKAYSIMYSVSGRLGRNINIGLLNTNEAREGLMQYGVYRYILLLI